MTAGFKHFDAHSVETNRMAFNGNMSTFDFWDTETAVRFAHMVNANKHACDPVDAVAKTLNGGADMELWGTYCTKNSHLGQAVQQNRTTVHTVHNALRQASMSARPADPSLTSNNGRCISEYPDGEYELAHAPHLLTPSALPGPSASLAGRSLSVSGNAVRDRVCVSCTLGMEYQPLPERASCFPTSVCEEPFIETIPPTLTTDRLCSCDTLTCNKLVTQLFEEMVCAKPTDEQLDVVLDVCCSNQGEDCIRDTIRQMDAYEARHSCPGCTDTCECSAGFILRTRAPTSTSNTKCEPCPIGTTDHDRNPLTACQPCLYGHYVPAGSIGSCKQFLCPAGTADLDRRNASTRRVRRARLAWTLPPSLAQRDCTPVTECDLGYEEMVRPTIFTDRQCRRCIEALFYRDSNTDFSTRVCRPASLALPDGPHVPQQHVHLAPAHAHDAEPQASARRGRSACLTEYELVAPSLVNDRECQRVRTRARTRSMRCRRPRPRRTASAPPSATQLEFNALADTQSRHEAFEAALGTIIATVASINEDFTARLFNRSVSGDITVMAFTASPCEADAFLDDSSLWLHGNHLKASDAVGSWTITALLEEPLAAAVVVVVVVHAMATAATADEVVVVNVLAFLTSSSNSKEVVAVLLVGTHVLTIVGAMAGSSSCCNARQ
ncbi:hypothetical protein, variant [Salpingoeca rosetta]|nr:hypothetical protein, variant [Salpingoeca rosetta]EGD81243.1 hypothetical protein, variant [Salpingoeca rosetta]|eukprot:XP_004987777.1 hypothetical protein, variant [Salpingoeca rosetta]